jgi:hypothetical protein
MKQWEYMDYNPREPHDDSGYKKLNALGKEGWELVNMYYTSSGARGILKREIEQHPAQEVK